MLEELVAAAKVFLFKTVDKPVKIYYYCNITQQERINYEF